jgi:hypothetical protein
MAAKFSIAQDNPGARVTVGQFVAHVEADHFREPKTAEDRRRLFAASVRHVVLELSSHCNRRCRFCPNTKGSRLGAEILMPKEIFDRAINQLASIDYAETIYFHLYNEPLAAAEVLLERMRKARQRLPRARFAINSNGDYLTGPLLSQLEAAGLNQLYVSIYGPDQGRWDDDYIRKRAQAVADEIGLSAQMRSKPSIEHTIIGTVGCVSVIIAGRNLWDMGYDRGGLVPELRVHRSSPCLAPFTEFLIDHRGYALPCCNVYTDRPDHLPYVTGKIEGEADIFEIYAGARAQAWRRGLLTFHPGGDLCGGCSRGNYPELDTPENQAAIQGLRRGVLVG